MDSNGSQGLMLLSLTICLFAGFLNSSQSSDEEFQESGRTDEASSSHPAYYTPEEHRLICSQLETLGHPRCKSTWTKIEQALKVRRDSGSKGFKRERTADAARKHFFRAMLQKNIDIIPDCVKEMLEEHPKLYTKEEDDFIIAHLLSFSGNQLHHHEVWQNIKREHDIKVDLQAKGFLTKKSLNALRIHYYQTLERQGRVPQAVLQKYDRPSRTEPGSSSGAFNRPRRRKRSLRRKRPAQEVDAVLIDFLGKELADVSEQDEGHDEHLDRDNDDEDDFELTKLKL